MNKQSEWMMGLLKGEYLVATRGYNGAMMSYNELRNMEGWCNIEYYKGFKDYLDNYKERNNV